MKIVFVSNGPTEDAIGARIAQHLGSGKEILALPLVGQGNTYVGIAQAIHGPRKSMPSGGFIFGSWQNLLADLKAGFLSMTLAQWRAARSLSVDAVIVVGDAYALTVGLLAAKGAPIFHVNPLVSTYYLENASFLELALDWGGSDFTPYERLLHRSVKAVFVRDLKSLERLKRLGVHHAYWYGSFAMDLLPPPERDLDPLVGEAPVMALIPGTRGDETFSLPLMLEASLRVPLTPVVAWAKAWNALPPLPGWQAQEEDAYTLRLTKAGKVAWVLRESFSAILHRSVLALSTAGTASEQAAGLGIPIVGFPTPGPQYTRAFARRQKRLLGPALRLTEADPHRIAAEVLFLLNAQEAYVQASQEGKRRIGPPGGITGTAQHIRNQLENPEVS